MKNKKKQSKLVSDTVQENSVIQGATLIHYLQHWPD